jgi:hypothetical protein
MAQAEDAYPVQYSVDYPDRPLNRLTTFFRMFTVIPIFILLSLVERGGPQVIGGVLFVAPLLMILFRQKYPRWWFDWNLQVARFGARVGAYFALLRDEYPSTDDEQAVHLDFPYPEVREDLNRWLPLVKCLLAIPHYIILVFLVIAVLVAILISWFAILFTGRYPRGLFDFVVGVGRWWYRVWGYAFILVTDRYPPFRLSA